MKIYLLLFVVLANLVNASGYEFGGLGAKAIGRGGAFIGLADDWSAIYWNPAGLSNLKDIGVGSYLEYVSLKGMDWTSVKNSLPELFAYPLEPISFEKKDIKTSNGVDITKCIDVNTRFITLGAGYKKGNMEAALCYANTYGKETLQGAEYKKTGYAVGITGIYKF